MHVHHLDCAEMCPFGGARLGGVDRMVGHCLLIEGPSSLVLVDTGFGEGDARDQRLSRLFRFLAGPLLKPEGTAKAQIVARGFRLEDVRDVIVTHLDLDHAGGLSDFPHARVHLLADEHVNAMAPPTLIEKLRYVRSQWAHGPKWELHRAGGEAWRGFDAVRAIPGLPPELLLIPLAGHTRGHTGVAVDHGGGWLLHAGDQYAHRGRMTADGRIPVGIAAFERTIAWDHAQVVGNQRRLRELVAGHTDVRVFSAHDPDEFDALAAGAR